MTAVDPVLSPSHVKTSEEPLRFETVVEQADLDALEGEWDALVESMARPSPFLLHAWLAEWWRHHGAAGQLAVHVARRGERLVGALPLCVFSRHGLRVASFVGGESSELGDVLCAAGEEDGVVHGLVARASRSGHAYAVLHGLPRTSRLAAAVGDLKRVERLTAPVLDLSGGWDDVYARRVSAKKRNLHRRRRRQLAELGDVTVRTCSLPDDIDAILDETFRLHDLRWRGRYDGSEYTTPAGRRFHRAAFARLAEQDRVRIVVLHVDGHPVAFHQYFALQGCMYVYRLAFDPALSRCSPGLLATLDALEAAAGEGLTRVEFLGGGERYKLELADGVDPLYDGFGLAPTLHGRLAASAHHRAIDARVRLKGSERLRSTYHRARSLLRA